MWTDFKYGYIARLALHLLKLNLATCMYMYMYQDQYLQLLHLTVCIQSSFSTHTMYLIIFNHTADLKLLDTIC